MLMCLHLELKVLLLTRLVAALFGGLPRRLLAGLKIKVGGSSGKKQEKFCSARLYFAIDVALVRKMKKKIFIVTFFLFQKYKRINETLIHEKKTRKVTRVTTG